MNISTFSIRVKKLWQIGRSRGSADVKKGGQHSLTNLQSLFSFFFYCIFPHCPLHSPPLPQLPQWCPSMSPFTFLLDPFTPESPPSHFSLSVQLSLIKFPQHLLRDHLGAGGFKAWQMGFNKYSWPLLFPVGFL